MKSLWSKHFTILVECLLHFTCQFTWFQWLLSLYGNNALIFRLPKSPDIKTFVIILVTLPLHMFTWIPYWHCCCQEVENVEIMHATHTFFHWGQWLFKWHSCLDARNEKHMQLVRRRNRVENDKVHSEK